MKMEKQRRQSISSCSVSLLTRRLLRQMEIELILGSKMNNDIIIHRKCKPEPRLFSLMESTS